MPLLYHICYRAVMKDTYRFGGQFYYIYFFCRYKFNIGPLLALARNELKWAESRKVKEEFDLQVRNRICVFCIFLVVCIYFLLLWIRFILCLVYSNNNISSPQTYVYRPYSYIDCFLLKFE